MGAFSGPEINEDGLVLALDAANVKSYGGSGTTWSDLSGQGNDGTINGATHTSGTGGYFDFDGSNDYIYGTSTNFDFGTGDFTVSGWFYMESSGSNNCVWDLRTDGPFSNNNNFLLRTTGNTNYELRFANSSIRTFTASSNTWNNIVFSRIGSTLSTYVNGSLDGSNSNSSNSTNGESLRIGTFIDTTQNYNFNGRISNFMVYKGKGLTASEIQQNFNALRGRFGI